MGQTGSTVFQEKRYPASQRMVILQFASVEEAEAWDLAGRPLTVSLHATAENEQDQSDDRQNDEDRPEHGLTVPVKRRAQPSVHHIAEFRNLSRPQSKRRRP